MFVIVEASLHLGPPSCAQRDAGLGPGRADLLDSSPLREAPAGLPDHLIPIPLSNWAAAELNFQQQRRTLTAEGINTVRWFLRSGREGALRLGRRPQLASANLNTSPLR